jgi:hypothetical protein
VSKVRTNLSKETLATDLPEEYKTSIIQVIAFKRECEKWQQWKIKNQAIGMKKK